MTDLASWLLAQIADDEAAARAAHVETALPAVWAALFEQSGYSGASAQTAMAHIARHDPARVLAECAAKKAIVEACQETLAKEDAWDPMTEGGTGEEFELARFVLQQLANRP